MGECSPTCAASLLALTQAGQLFLVDESDIPAELFLDLLTRFNLGEGETECLTVCNLGNFTFCCDDARARAACVELFGSERVIGSLRLLRWAVEDGLVSREEAFDAYERMKRAGGFLPLIRIDYFSSAR
jgi:predicted nucleic acid-binding protein